MPKIKDIKARQIIDSRGNPTVECDITLDNQFFGRASAPSGASTGVHEAVELRDNNAQIYNGKSVNKAVNNILEFIKPRILNKEYVNFKEFDKEIINIDGTSNKSKMGANAILALSLAFVKALSSMKNCTMYQLLSDDNHYTLPVPMMNIINGGMHADNNLDIQEFMITPIGASNFSDAVRYGSEIFHSLKSKLKSKGLNTNVGDEGGFAPNLKSTKQALDYILESIDSVGLKIKKDILLSLDVASSEFYSNNQYNLKGEKKIFTSDQMIKYLKDLVAIYPIYSIEDGLSEDDWDGWKNLTKELGRTVQLVGDDLFVTNFERLQKGINNGIANSILIKLNQIGSVSETISVMKLAKQHNYTCIVSHRSGETEDTSIADLSVGMSSGQIKTGSITRTDRTSKYNQLLRIEEELGNKSVYAGKSILRY
ncbi:MAG: Enolase [Alphaproteobacteria bacterium MarineAlpha5_Bin8]|nr:MAG: Enolase [Alphaproteobacteria bacterium MarineAlpha5_Bin8]PPR45835.1 MAG: Enolase [Alphaproteobacteria bacterium MarineAlpha5_Bin7]|tara:strand:+ start:117 stop:1394 length:1278 start_codon:yes stop_codon:yes gene_type:complete